ncbi:MAG: amino acid ABC transporter substrate-binding protein [Rhodospirillales bacterium]|nr:amino acid ABC transporter substrate-binding protein [Rhodospirillales bacterium]
MKRMLFAAALAANLVSPALAQELTGTLQKINDSGTIVLGHREDSPPFSFVDKSKQPAGYSVDLCLRIVEAVKERLGRSDITVKYVMLGADERLDKVADGTVDIECGNTTHTISRQEKVDFTNMTFITGASLLLPAGSTIQSVGDLAGKRVSVVEGTTTETTLRERLKQSLVEAKVVTVKDHGEAMKLLSKGEVDAHAGDQIVLIGLARAAKDPTKFMLAPELFTYEPYALVVRRNDADFRVVADGALAQLYRSGQIAQVYDKWFGDWGGRPSRLLLAMYALNGLPQ